MQKVKVSNWSFYPTEHCRLLDHQFDIGRCTSCTEKSFQDFCYWSFQHRNIELKENNDTAQKIGISNLDGQQPVEVVDMRLLCKAATRSHPCDIHRHTNRFCARNPCQCNNYCNCCIRMFAFGLKTYATDQ